MHAVSARYVACQAIFHNRHCHDLFIRLFLCLSACPSAKNGDF